MDRMEVIKALSDFSKNGICLPHLIPWKEINVAISLLKEQEAVEPILKYKAWNKYYNYYVCPRCGYDVDYDQNYCSECGVRFLWEGRQSE